MVNASKPLRETNSEAADIIRPRAWALRSAPKSQSLCATATSVPSGPQTDNKSVLSLARQIWHLSHQYAQLSEIIEDCGARSLVLDLSTLFPTIDPLRYQG